MKCYNENKRGDKTDRKGWVVFSLVRVKGDHRQYKGTLNSILKLKQAGLKEGEIAIPEPSTKAVSIEVTA